MIGGNVKLMMSAAAPIDGDLISMLKIIFWVPFTQVYGQTETCGPWTMTYW